MNWAEGWKQLRNVNAMTLCGLMLLPLSTALASPGDTLRVVGERVNLRAGPTDDANVRSQVMQDEQLLELRRDGNWYGVRVLRTGEEGWIFGDLIAAVQPTTLTEGSVAAPSAGFRELSPEFDGLLATVTQLYGFPLFDAVRQGGNNTLEAVLSTRWLRAGSDDEHLLAAVALYEMWKNHQNGASVRVELLEPDGTRYIAIGDGNTDGPVLSLSAD
jgi:hypothetical protein